jgi:ferredoxin
MNRCATCRVEILILEGLKKLAGVEERSDDTPGSGRFILSDPGRVEEPVVSV